MTFVIPSGRAGIEATFGVIEFGPDGWPTRAWEQAHLKVFPLPYPLRLEYGEGQAVNKLYCHKLAGPVFQAIFEHILADGLTQYARMYSGCYAPRLQRGSGSKLSTHSWAIAIDLNARKNPLGAEPRQHAGVIAAFAKYGAVWGGTWKRPDGMHFQLARAY